MKIAAIDVGSNSIHLLITRVLPDHSYEIVYKDKAMVRLGNRAFARGVLAEPAQRRAFTALERFARVIRRFEVDQVVGVATSAVREAANGAAFLREARRRTGLKIDRISGAEEARLVAVAVAALAPFNRGRHLVVDIGGGSTELAFLQDEEPRQVLSLKIGAVRLTELVRPGDCPGKKGLKQLRAAAAEMMGGVLRRVRGETFKSVVGTSGSIVCLGMLALRRAGLPMVRGQTFAVPRALLARELGYLASLPLEARREYMAEQAPRADIILAGGAILLELLEGVENDRVHVPDRSIRDGVVVDYIRQRLEATPDDHLRGLTRMAGAAAGDPYDPHAVRERSVVALARRYQYEALHAHQVMNLAGQIFDATARLHGLGPDEKFYLEAAALLHDIGQFISYSQHHKHSMYLIMNGSLPGFSEREVAVIAGVARYHRKAWPVPAHPEFGALAAEDRRTVRSLASLLRLADGLDDGHLNSVRRVRADIARRRVLFHVSAERECASEVERARTKADLFEKTFGCRVSFKARKRAKGGST